MVAITKPTTTGSKSVKPKNRSGRPSPADAAVDENVDTSNRQLRPDDDDDVEVLDVVVVGAGWSGIAAANTLLKNRVVNFTVLEARDYVGGRSRTTYELGDDKPVDLGSSWVHGMRNNPVQKLVRKHKLPYEEAEETSALLSPDGRWLSSYEMRKLYIKYNVSFEKFMNQKRKSLKRGDKSADTSLRAVADEFARKMKMSEDDRRGFEWTLNAEIVQDYAASLDELSLRWWDADDELSGDDAYLAVEGGGYTAVIEAYAKPVMDKIQLRSRVTAIEYGEEHARVRYTDAGDDDGSGTEERTIVARHVLVTLPLGVLKEGAVRFSPPLPAAKQKAIHDLGCALMNKVVLHWEGMAESDIFWPKEKEWIMNIAQSAGEQGLWTEFYNAHSLNGQTTLIAFVVGDHARRMETLSDEEAVREATESLRRMFGGAGAVPDPTSTIVTRWGADEFSRCSYSFQKVGSDGRSRKDLASTVSDKLWFAGEATDTKYPATTHGALMSGNRAAQRVTSAISKATSSARRGSGKRVRQGRKFASSE